MQESSCFKLPNTDLFNILFDNSYQRRKNGPPIFCMSMEAYSLVKQEAPISHISKLSAAFHEMLIANIAMPEIEYKCFVLEFCFKFMRKLSINRLNYAFVLCKSILS